MPKWALFGFAAVTVAVLVSLSTVWVLTLSERHGWTIGVTALVMGAGALLAAILVLILVGTALRSIDRRTR